jgi:hypothetical protein
MPTNETIGKLRRENRLMIQVAIGGLRFLYATATRHYPSLAKKMR